MCPLSGGSTLYSTVCDFAAIFDTQPTVKELAALSSENRDLRESAERDKATIEALVQKLKTLQDKVCILEHTLHHVDGFAKSFRTMSHASMRHSAYWVLSLCP